MLSHEFAEKAFDVHLGVADKYLLNVFFPSYEKKRQHHWTDSIGSFLYLMGYRSTKLNKRYGDI